MIYMADVAPRYIPELLINIDPFHLVEVEAFRKDGETCEEVIQRSVAASREASAFFDDGTLVSIQGFVEYTTYTMPWMLPTRWRTRHTRQLLGKLEAELDFAAGITNKPLVNFIWDGNTSALRLAIVLGFTLGESLDNFNRSGFTFTQVYRNP